MNQHPQFGLQYMLDEEIPWVQVEPGVKRKVLSFDDRVMMVKVAFDKGSVGALHHHPHLQISYVAAGAFEITISGEKKILRQGDGYYIPSNEVHGAVCLEAGILVDVFTPVREDFI